MNEITCNCFGLSPCPHTCSVKKKAGKFKNRVKMFILDMHDDL